MTKLAIILLLLSLALPATAGAESVSINSTAAPHVTIPRANPILRGADPHAIAIGDTFWVYPTWSEPGQQQFFAFSSTNLVDWQRHGPVLDFRNVTWIKDDGAPVHYAWAPAVFEADHTFYFYYSVGPQNPRPARLGVAIANSPSGPFIDSGKPLLTGGNGFEAIDPMVFQDPQSGRVLLYAGGSAGAKLRVFEMNPDLVSFAREIPVETPPQFTEGVFMHYQDGRYYISYSRGSWRHSSYSVHYSSSHSPTGPWTYHGAILTSEETRKGPGHHSFLKHPATGDWLIFYHRWENQPGDGPYRGSRQICVDRVEHDAEGLIKPVVMTSGPGEKPGSATRPANGTSLLFANNIIVGGNRAISIDGFLPNPKWEGNILWNNQGGAGDLPKHRFSPVDPMLKPDAGGIFRILPGSPAIGKGVGVYHYVNVDIDGQVRPSKMEVGADQLSDQPIRNRVLTIKDVGPGAPEKQRSLIRLASGAAEPERIIFDTDMDSDCDDAGALALLHALADRGEAEILATMVSSKHPWSASCVDAINTFFGRPDLPVGVPKGPGAIEQGSKFARQIAQQYPHDLPTADEAPDATPIYRRILADQPDGTVVVVTIGDLTNIRYLLESGPDTHSPLDGRALVRRKVKHWVCMGSRYPADSDPRMWGNFKPDAESTVKAIDGWPTLITFTGGGEFAESLATGQRLRELPANDPVRRVYELYFNGEVQNRHSADQIAVLIAVRGTGHPWKRVQQGFNEVFANGTHAWREHPDDPNQQYISALAEGVDPRNIADAIEDLMLHRGPTCTPSNPGPPNGSSAVQQ